MTVVCTSVLGRAIPIHLLFFQSYHSYFHLFILIYKLWGHFIKLNAIYTLIMGYDKPVSEFGINAHL